MISEKQLPELAIYRRLERRLPVKSIPDYNRLVIPNTNDLAPIHRWFRFKEGFSADLLRSIIDIVYCRERQLICVADPFCGVGTSLVSSQELSRVRNIGAVGIERNPFIHFVARTKVSWPLMDARKILELAAVVLQHVPFSPAAVPALSSFTTGRCMSRYTTMRLAAVRNAIRENGNSANHDALLLGLASAVEQLSKTRKDGRALRLVGKDRQDIATVLLEKWAKIAADVTFMQRLAPRASIPRVILGDGRCPTKCGLAPGSIDLVVTSPPYPNNIDYSEVYKLELWLLGFVRNPQEFLALRKSTFRSHPTAAEAELDEEFRRELAKGTIKSVLGPILERTKASAERHRHRMILGYASDIWATLRDCHRLLKAHARCAIVVGNSLHGGKHSPYLIPTDLLVSSIGQRTGYRVASIVVARNLRRRISGNHFLRESVVLLEKQ